MVSCPHRVTDNLEVSEKKKVMAATTESDVKALLGRALSTFTVTPDMVEQAISERKDGTIIRLLLNYASEFEVTSTHIEKAITAQMEVSEMEPKCRYHGEYIVGCFSSPII